MAKKWWQKKRSTKVVLDPEGESYCTYHDTTVVRWTKTHVTLYMGGWDTLTTRTRMNECDHEYGLGYSVYRHKGETFVSVPSGHICEEKKTKVYNFGYLANKEVKFRRRRNPRKWTAKKCPDCLLKKLATVGEGRGYGYYY